MVEIKRPTINARELVERTRVEAEREARLEPPEAEDPRELKRLVAAHAAELVERRIKADMARSRVNEKAMLKEQRLQEREQADAEKEIERLTLANKTYPSDAEIATRLGGAKRRKNKARSRAGRAGQAASEWQVYRAQLGLQLREAEREAV